MTKFVLAVSGGVDSMVLLDQMQRRYSPSQLVVAHVNHGIRPEPAGSQDEALVRQVAKRSGLEFRSVRLQLSQQASEDQARQRRYGWLDQIKQQERADHIVTAHHQDDVIETILINLERGTGWAGLASLRSSDWRLRPLLDTAKSEIIDYALSHNLQWNEDSTNSDLSIQRNRIRQMVVPWLSQQQRSGLLDLYQGQLAIRVQVELEVNRLLELASDQQGLSRYFLIMLPPEVADELAMAWLGGRLTSWQRMRLRRFVAVARPGDRLELGSGFRLVAKRCHLVV